jgi:hypothetical protein
MIPSGCTALELTHRGFQQNLMVDTPKMTKHKRIFYRTNDIFGRKSRLNTDSKNINAEKEAASANITMGYVERRL